MVHLGPRLKTVISFIENGSSVIDVGCDHGYVPIFLIQNGICRHVTATDIRQGPLNSAIRSAEENGVSDKIDFILADGLKNVPHFDADTVVIAGMGGETMIGILEGEDWLISEDVKLILQPQSKTDELLLWLNNTGFLVSDAAFAKEDGRLYLIITAISSDGKDVNAQDVLMILKEKADPHYMEYLDDQIKKYERIYKGISKSEHKDSAISEVKTKIEFLKRLREEKKNGNSWQDI